MSRPIVIAYHLIWTAYGWWLPNDPRGSTSATIRNDVLADLGTLHQGRKSVQPAAQDLRAFYAKAETKLKWPLLEFDAPVIEGVALAFAETIEIHRYTCYACVIMPDHIHIVIRKHNHLAEQMIPNFQESSRLRLRASGLRDPFHPLWGGPGWKVFLDHPNEIRRTIRYVEENPVKLRMPVRKYSFVKEYDGWPLHPGHSPVSPYARRMREE
jgi:REP element-mobilizing transposase RayT